MRQPRAKTCRWRPRRVYRNVRRVGLVDGLCGSCCRRTRLPVPPCSRCRVPRKFTRFAADDGLCRRCRDLAGRVVRRRAQRDREDLAALPSREAIDALNREYDQETARLRRKGCRR